MSLFLFLTSHVAGVRFICRKTKIMKQTSFINAILAFALTLAVASSCEDLFRSGNQGMLQVSFTKDLSSETKSSMGIPDPGSFLLTVTDSKGKQIYSGAYSASPENMEVSPGSYTVEVRSCEFREPLFDSPQWGDTQVVSVGSGQCVNVLMNCTQMNSGIRLLPDATFRTAYPSATLYIKGNGGSLMYDYSEKRIAFFQPGTISILLADGGKQETICNRQLLAQEILSLGLSADLVETKDGRIKVQVDTTRNWVSDNYSSGGSSSSASAYSVTEARNHAGEKKAWVKGYIVGVATNTGKFSFEGPFTKNTNIVLGLRTSSTSAEYLLSVELPKGDVRDELNLQDNPGLLGTQVKVCGDIVDAYYGIVGIKNTSEYWIE